MDELKKEIQEIKEKIYDITLVVDKLRYIAVNLDREYTEKAAEKFFKEALIKDPEGRIIADEFASYLIQYFAMKEVLHDGFDMKVFLNSKGYNAIKIDDKYYIEGLLWNPEYERSPLVPLS